MAEASSSPQASAQGLCTALPVTRPSLEPYTILAPPASIWSLYWVARAEPPCHQRPVEENQGRLRLAGWGSMATQNRLAGRGEGGGTDTGNQRCRRCPPRDPWSTGPLLPLASPLLPHSHGLGGQSTSVPLLVSGVPDHEYWQNASSVAGWKPDPSTHHPPSPLT